MSKFMYCLVQLLSWEADTRKHKQFLKCEECYLKEITIPKFEFEWNYLLEETISALSPDVLEELRADFSKQKHVTLNIIRAKVPKRVKIILSNPTYYNI